MPTGDFAERWLRDIRKLLLHFHQAQVVVRSRLNFPVAVQRAAERVFHVRLQMAKTLADLRESLTKVQGIHDDTWTQENYNVELTRSLTVIDNARMEWNAARLKWPLLAVHQVPEENTASAEKTAVSSLESLGFLQLCKLGLAFTWPLALVALAALGVLIFILSGHK